MMILSIGMILSLAAVRITSQTLYSCNTTTVCGCSANPALVSRIVGGETAGIATWSWTVSLSIASDYLCGGSILSNSWIITAAHCVYDKIGSPIIVYAGSNILWSGTQSRSVSRVIVHSKYNSANYTNDIALLQLTTPLDMNDLNVSSICMPLVDSTILASGEWPPVNTTVVAVGWGRLTEGGSLPQRLQQVTLETVDYRASTCSPLIADKQVQLCASVPGGTKDTCQGDSGGPLMMFTESKQWLLVGLTSNGIGCARAAYAGIYTRVAAYKDWVRTYTNDSSWIVIDPGSPSPANTGSTSTAHSFCFIVFIFLVAFC